MIRNNIKALAPYLTDTQKQALEELRSIGYSVLGNNDDEYTLYYDGMPLTHISERKYTEQQLRTYLSSPKTFRMPKEALNYYKHYNNPEVVEVGDFAFKYCQKLYQKYEHLTNNEAVFDEEEKVLIIFGLHLGFQVETLCKELKAKHVYILDDNLGCLYQSMLYNDWNAVVDSIESLGGRITFIINDDLDELIFALNDIFRAWHILSYEGCHIYQHAESPRLNRIARRFSSNIEGMLSYVGWLEDELLFLNNSVLNAKNSSGKLVVNQYPKANNIKALIVGSGPSLDNDIFWIKQNREKFIIFSAGSALRPLLEGGIRPDFHVELENGNHVYKILMRMNERFGLDGIRLLCSITCNEGLKFLTDDIWFFAREGEGLINWYAETNNRILAYSAPSCTNAAMACAKHLGFKNLVLAGMDFGSASIETHHSKKSIYCDEDGKDSFLHRMSVMNSHKFPIETEANFGGVAYTNIVFNIMRARLQESINKMPELSFQNISNGARILGAEPVRSIDLIFENQDKREDIIRDLVGFYKMHPGELVSPQKLETLQALYNSVFDQISIMIADDKKTIVQAMNEIFLYLSNSDVQYYKSYPIQKSLKGSFQKIFMCIRFLTHRGLNDGQITEIRLSLKQLIDEKKNELDAFIRFLSNIFSGDDTEQTLSTVTPYLGENTMFFILLHYLQNNKTDFVMYFIKDVFINNPKLLKPETYLVSFLLKSMRECGLVEDFKLFIEQVLLSSEQKSQSQIVFYIWLCLQNSLAVNYRIINVDELDSEALFLLAIYELWSLKSENISYYISLIEQTEKNEFQDFYVQVVKAANLSLKGNINKAYDILENASKFWPNENILSVEKSYINYLKGSHEKNLELVESFFINREEQIDLLCLNAKTSSKWNYPKDHLGCKRIGKKLEFIRANME